MFWVQKCAERLEAKALTLHGILFMSATVTDVFATVLAAYLVFRYERRRVPADAAFPDFLSYLLPKSVFFHRSARLDYQVYILRRIIGFPLSLPGVIGITTVGAMLAAHPEFSLRAGHAPAGTLTVLLCAACLAVAIDFSNYVGHVAQHKVGFFWEFHKVHHAAEVLTPITLDRTHPVEDIPKLLVCSALFALIFAGFGLFWRLDVIGTMAIGLDVLLWMRVALLFRLRHSHIPMFFPDWLTTVFFSPVHHQTHHSSLERHFDSNYGQNLIIWDRMFGTLVPPEHPSQLRLGLSDRGEVALNRSLFHMYWLPICHAWRRLVPRPARGLVPRSVPVPAAAMAAAPVALGGSD